MKSVVTIAGSDSSGGAGIQADLKTIEALGLFGQSVITALTAQNTTGVFGVFDIPPEFVTAQLDAVFEDIRPDAVKIGMVSSPEIVKVIAEGLARFEAKKIVVDPVMVATSGSALAADGAIAALARELFPIAAVLTPNILEAQALTELVIESPADQEAAAKVAASKFNVPVLVKGGHGANDANDVLAWPDGRTEWFYAERIENPNTHGTGCTLSSAIACGLASEMDLTAAIRQAKTYLEGALSTDLNLGQGSGPLNHMYFLA